MKNKIFYKILSVVMCIGLISSYANVISVSASTNPVVLNVQNFTYRATNHDFYVDINFDQAVATGTTSYETLSAGAKIFVNNVVAAGTVLEWVSGGDSKKLRLFIPESLWLLNQTNMLKIA